MKSKKFGCPCCGEEPTKAKTKIEWQYTETQECPTVVVLEEKTKVLDAHEILILAAAISGEA